MAKGKLQDGSISLQVVKPLSRDPTSWHSLQAFSLPAAVTPMGPNAWALTGIRSLEVGLVLLQLPFASAACSAPSQAGLCPLQGQGASFWFRACPQHTKMKVSLMVQASSPESLLPALLYTANYLQQTHFHLIQLHVLHDHLSAARGTVTQQRDPSPIPGGELSAQRPWGLAKDRAHLVELANSLALPYHLLTLQLFIDVIFKVLSL